MSGGIDARLPRPQYDGIDRKHLREREEKRRKVSLQSKSRQSIKVVVKEFTLPNSTTSTIEKLICAIAVWLYVTAGSSRSVTNSLLRALSYLTATIFTLLGVALAGFGITINFPAVKIPRDVRSAYRRHFSEPKLKRTKCCPKCFYMYDRPDRLIPRHCGWKASPRSRVCGAALWRKQRTRNGWKKVAACLYTTQSFKEWLRFFLSRKVIDDALQQTFWKQVNNPVGIGSEMRDVHDSPAWRDLYGNQQNPYNLVFGIYIDWFRVFKLKIAGKSNNLTYMIVC